VPQCQYSMLGRTVSHYHILDKLGRGGMGVVYVAEDTHLARDVAVKFCTSARDNPQFRARLLREARAASRLNHPNIAGVYDYGETPEGDPFIVMELVKGEDLFHLLRRGPLPVLQSLRIVESVAAGLAEAHRQGIIHRDIKPSNIVVGENGTVKVLDFGLAKQMEKPPGTTALGNHDDSTVAVSETEDGVVLGTPAYMSPEQAREGTLGPPTDLFSLGAVLYECLAGRPAFSGANNVEILASVLHVEPPPPSRFNPALPPELDRIALKALSKASETRYQSADQMLADLRPVIAGRDVNAETELLPPRPQAQATSPSSVWKSLATLAGPLRRSRLRAGLVLAGLAAAAVAGWWVVARGGYQPPVDAIPLQVAPTHGKIGDQSGGDRWRQHADLRLFQPAVHRCRPVRRNRYHGVHRQQRQGAADQNGLWIVPSAARESQPDGAHQSERQNLARDGHARSPDSVHRHAIGRHKDIDQLSMR
jgi:serine/threonine protein kinase